MRASNLLSQTVNKSTVLSLPLDISHNWLLQRTLTAYLSNFFTAFLHDGNLAHCWWVQSQYFCYLTDFIIPSPTKLRRDIVTLPSVLPFVCPSFRPSHPCEHSRINILQWILTKLGTYLVLKRIWNPIDFQGHKSNVKVTGSNFYRITSLWTL